MKALKLANALNHVYDLLRSDVRAAIIERDDDLPPFGHLLAEVRRAEGLLHESRRIAR